MGFLPLNVEDRDSENFEVDSIYERKFFGMPNSCGGLGARRALDKCQMGARQFCLVLTEIWAPLPDFELVCWLRVCLRLCEMVAIWAGVLEFPSGLVFFCIYLHLSFHTNSHLPSAAFSS